MPVWPEELEFEVCSWTADGHVSEVFARCSNVIIGRAAYEVAVRLNPGALITLRHRARVIERSNLRPV